MEPFAPRRFKTKRDIIWYIPASYMDAIKDVKRNCYKCVPMPDPGQEKNISKVVEQIRPRVLASDMGKLSESFVKTAHAKDVMVFVDDDSGTVDKWKKILKWGTDDIQTDQPAALIAFLKN